MDAEAAARFLGWPPHFMPFLARAGHLKPLEKRAQNERKWYAMMELERLNRDPAWLDKAIRIVDRLVREANGKQEGKGYEEALAAQSPTFGRRLLLLAGGLFGGWLLGLGLLLFRFGGFVSHNFTGVLVVDSPAAC